jgi:ribulose kinase
MSLLGLNALEPSKMGLITGSSNVMFVLADRPVFSPSLWGPYPEPILPEKWLMEAGQTSSGSVINWLVENLLAATGAGVEAKDGLLAKLEEKIQGVEPGFGGVVMLDYWQGNRTPRRNPRAKGLFFGLTLGHDFRHLVRSAYEGISFGTRHILETLRDCGIEVRQAAAGGGGARSQVWLQLTADVCDLPIKIPRYADACGVLGSAICAACAAGFYPSLAQASGRMVSEERRIEPRGISEKFERSYQTYLRLYEATRPLL